MTQKPADKSQHIIVIGGGAWGAAIATALSTHDDHHIECLVRSEATKEALSAGHVPRLNGVSLPHPIPATTKPDCLAKADIIYLVLPAAATSQMMAIIDRHTNNDIPIILCAKGLVLPDVDNRQEADACFLPDFMRCFYPDRPFALLSGPSFADEVIQGLPAALVAASDDPLLSDQMISHFSQSNLRLYQGHDVMGVAIGGTVKNVIALAAGISAGLGLGDNAKAALITRGLAETSRLITKLGGTAETMRGLAGIGDLTLSASGPHSRNMAYGYALGSGTSLPDALSEGARTAPLLAKMAEHIDCDMPITNAVRDALQGANLQQIITDLLARPAVEE